MQVLPNQRLNSSLQGSAAAIESRQELEGVE